MEQKLKKKLLAYGVSALALSTGGSAFSSPAQPNIKQFSLIEAKALRIGNADDLAAYQNAIAARYFPELKLQAGAVKVAGTPEQEGLAAYVKTMLNPKAGNNLLERRVVARDNSEKFRDSVEGQFGKDGTGGTALGFVDSLTNLYGKPIEHQAFLSHETCPSCKPAAVTTSCDVIHPDVHRYNQLNAISTADHEFAHLVRLQKGVLTYDTNYEVNYEERLANTYAALRMMQRKLPDGEHFVELESKYSGWPNSGKGQGGALSHYSTPDLRQVLTMKPAEYMRLNPRQTLALAEQLVSRLTPEQFALQEEAARMANQLEVGEINDRISTTAITFQMVRETGDAQPIRAAVQSATFQTLQLANMTVFSDIGSISALKDTLAEKNPLRNGAFSGSGFEGTEPKNKVDMAALTVFNAGLGRPSSCPSVDETLAEAAKQVADPPVAAPATPTTGRPQP